MENEVGEKIIQISPFIGQESILYSPDIVQHERDGVCLLVDPASPNWASVNTLGSAIIRRCDGRRTLREVVEWANLEYGLPQAAILEFIESGARAGLISETPDLSPAYPGRSAIISPSTLEELWIYTNSTCPLRCKHCLVDGGTGSPEMMAAGEIKKLVDDAVSLGAGRIYFTGGEPFLRKDLIELADYVTARAQLVILTCGVLINDEISQKLASLSRSNLIIQVSLEGPDGPTNDAIRGEGSFERALSGIRSLLGAGIVPIVTTTLTQLNYLKAPETTRFLAGLGIKDHHVLWLHQCGRARHGTDELLLSGQEIAWTMERMREAARESGIVLDNSESLAVRTKGRGHKNDLCNSCYGVLAVNTNSHVYPCASLVGTPEFDCGSIKEQNLRSIWLESPGTMRIRENSVQKKSGCNACYLKFFCGGGCFAQAYSNHEMNFGNGCIMAADPYCEVYRTQLLNIIWESAMPGADEINPDLPLVYRVMENKLPGCAAASYNTIDAAHDVGTYHCSCVLAMDVLNNRGGS
jgi:radical SAM protein with 4Fe4S-binding SPASM domain